MFVLHGTVCLRICRFGIVAGLIYDILCLFCAGPSALQSAVCASREDEFVTFFSMFCTGQSNLESAVFASLQDPFSHFYVCFARQVAYFFGLMSGI